MDGEIPPKNCTTQMRIKLFENFEDDTQSQLEEIWMGLEDEFDIKEISINPWDVMGDSEFSVLIELDKKNPNIVDEIVRLIKFSESILNIYFTKIVLFGEDLDHVYAMSNFIDVPSTLSGYLKKYEKITIEIAFNLRISDLFSSSYIGP